MSRDVHEKDYYTMEDTNKCLPIRWMSIEAIQFSTFTTESDVVSIEYLPITWLSIQVAQFNTFTTDSDIASYTVLMSLTLIMNILNHSGLMELCCGKFIHLVGIPMKEYQTETLNTTVLQEIYWINPHWFLMGCMNSSKICVELMAIKTAM